MKKYIIAYITLMSSVAYARDPLPHEGQRGGQSPAAPDCRGEIGLRVRER